jgi:hypothetical protein
MSAHPGTVATDCSGFLTNAALPCADIAFGPCHTGASRGYVAEGLGEGTACPIPPARLRVIQGQDI